RPQVPCPGVYCQRRGVLFDARDVEHAIELERQSRGIAHSGQCSQQVARWPPHSETIEDLIGKTNRLICPSPGRHSDTASAPSLRRSAVKSGRLSSPNRLAGSSSIHFQTSPSASTSSWTFAA